MGKSVTKTFSVDEDFIENVRKSIGEQPLSQAVVMGLRLYLQDMAGPSWGEWIQLTKRVGNLDEPVKFIGQWIIPPDHALKDHVKGRVEHYDCSTSGPYGNPELDENGNVIQFNMKIPAKTTWWAVALTLARSYIWIFSENKGGFERSDFGYVVQSFVRTDTAPTAQFSIEGVPDKLKNIVCQTRITLPVRVIE